uniref:Uncharacterized protein n=1 Tax=viral metagenome TaxID=1070528 RepID=A0A6C0I0F0_9ZZZZ
MNVSQIIFFILLIILLILSALVIGINSKLYIGNGGIKRGGTKLTNADIISTLKTNNLYIESAEDAICRYLKGLFNQKEDFDQADINDLVIDYYRSIYVDIGQTKSDPGLLSISSSNSSSSSSSDQILQQLIDSNQILQQLIANFPNLALTPESAALIIQNPDNISLAITEGDIRLAQSIIDSLLSDEQRKQEEDALFASLDNRVAIHPLYEAWSCSESPSKQMELIRRNEGFIDERGGLRYIRIAFPNFSDTSSTTIIDISEDPNNIYFNIKYAIWVWCVDSKKINDTPNNKNSYFCYGDLDACDKNGWTLDTFDINTISVHNPELKIKDFMTKCREKLSEIIFIPRGVEKTNFVKNKVYGRNDLSILYRTVDPISRDKFKSVCIVMTSLGYCGRRRVQGDGNCYYTSFIFNLLEYGIFSKNPEIILNIINALESVKDDIQDFIKIGDTIITKSEMETKYNSMIEALTDLIQDNIEVVNIFSLERLFNKQTPSGEPDGIFIPLIYGCRLLLYRYIVDNAERIKGCAIEIMINDLLERIQDTYRKSTAAPTLLLLMGEDIEYIVEIPFFAYIFKCKQRGIKVPNNGSKIIIKQDTNGSITKINELDEIIIYDEYKDPYSFVVDQFQDYVIPDNSTFAKITEEELKKIYKEEFLGIVNCVLVPGHYNIVYHSNNVPDPIPRISTIFKELITNGYYEDVGMASEDIPSYLTVDNLVNSLLQVKAASALEKLSQLKMESPQLLGNISDHIIVQALDTMPTADINKLIACKSAKINSYAGIETPTYEMLLDMMILASAITYNKSEYQIDERSVTAAYEHLNPSWISDDYLILFEKYRKQYVNNPAEFFDKIDRYFSKVEPLQIDNRRQRSEDFADLLHDYTMQLIRDMGNRLTTENTCNILIIGALEGETNKNTFIAPTSEDGKKINFIYCDVGLITDISSSYSGYNYKKIYIKYILDKNSFQIFSYFESLYKLYKLSHIFDYITFDGGVLGGVLITTDPIITIPTLIDDLYPLLKPNGKIYIENIIKMSPQISNISTAIIYNYNNDMGSCKDPSILDYTYILPAIRATKLPNGIRHTNAPADFEVTYYNWAEHANTIIKDKGIKINIAYRKDSGNYINPLLENGGGGSTIEISFQPLVSNLAKRVMDFGG